MAENDIARIAAQADLPAIASNFTAVKPKGREYVATCVFHSPDVNPSLTIFQKGGKWQFKCFSCGEGGDAIDWIEKLENVDTATACKRLNGDSHWEPKFKAPPKSAPLPDRITSKPPADAGRPYTHTRHIGSPVKEWDYRDTDGAFLGCVSRYETDGGKEFRCWTWGTRDSTPPRWDCGHWSGKRPLYGLDRLAARPNAPVLIVEGEKAADFAAQILPDYVAVCWPGGASAWHKVNWDALDGRTVLIWPDNDEPGLRAGHAIADLLIDPRGMALKVRIVDPTGQPEGWDIADWTGTRDELIAWAKPRARDCIRKDIIERIEPHELPPLSAYAQEPADFIPAAKANGSKPPNGQPPTDSVMWRRMSDIKPERTNWLWPGRIACGEISFLTGSPGLGKSQITASLASIVTNGGLWPVDRTRALQGSVIILSAEDNTSKTIRPRLDAAEADVSRVIVLDAVRNVTSQGEQVITGFSLAEDIAKLGALIHELTDVRLVIIDPISAYLGNIDSHNNAEVRGLLAPLQKMAEAQDVAVLCVTHQNKSSGMEALLKMQGSVAFSAAARGVWGVAKDKENPSRRYFMPLKNNLGTDDSGFAYSIEAHFIEPANEGEEKIPTSRVLWEPEAITASTEELFSPGETYEEKGAMTDAKAFLRDLLANGAVTSKQIEMDARGAGHSMTTLRRAADQMKVRRVKEGYGGTGSWKWSLP